MNATDPRAREAAEAETIRRAIVADPRQPSRRAALSAPERAAWRVSVRRGLCLDVADVAALAQAALAAAGVAELPPPADLGPEVDPVTCRRCGFSHPEAETDCPRWPDPEAPGWTAVTYLPAVPPSPGVRARSGVYHRPGSCTAGAEYVVTRLDWATGYGLRPCGTCCPPGGAR